MDPDLLSMLMEYILSRQTDGGNSIGGDTPYDDYDMDHTIGGLGAADPRPLNPQSENVIGNEEYGTAQPATGSPHPYPPLEEFPRNLDPLGNFPITPGWVDIPMIPQFAPPPRPRPTGPKLYEDMSMTNPFGGMSKPGRTREEVIEDGMSHTPEQKARTVNYPRDPQARGNRAETPPRTGMLPNGRAFPGVGPNGPASTVRQNAAPQGNALPAARRIANAASQQKFWTPAPASRAPSPRPAPVPYNPPAAQARNTYTPPAAPALRAALSALTRRR
jgi:hypothetical protein